MLYDKLTFIVLTAKVGKVWTWKEVGDTYIYNIPIELFIKLSS